MDRQLYDIKLELWDRCVRTIPNAMHIRFKYWLFVFFSLPVFLLTTSDAQTGPEIFYNKTIDNPSAGSSWILVDQATRLLAQTLWTGMAVTSHEEGALAYGEFSNLSVADLEIFGSK